MTATDKAFPAWLAGNASPDLAQLAREGDGRPNRCNFVTWRAWLTAIGRADLLGEVAAAIVTYRTANRMPPDSGAANWLA